MRFFSRKAEKGTPFHTGRGRLFERGYMKNKKNSPVAVVIFLIVMVAIVAGVLLVNDARQPSTDYVDGARYFSIEDSSEAAIIVNGSMTGTKGLVEDGRIFLPVETVRSTVNPSFYWSEKEEGVLITSPLEIKTCEFGGDGTADALLVDGEAFVSLDLVREWSDCKADVYEDPARVVITTVAEMAGVYALEDAVVREDADVRTDILKDVAGGETLILGDTEDVPNGWVRVTTADGFTGFISQEQVSSSFSFDVTLDKNAGDYTHLLSEEKIGLVFHQTTSQAANDALAGLMEKAQGVNVVAPTWFYLESAEGEMSSLASESYVTTAHALGLQVWAVANDFDGAVNGTTSTLEALSTRARREKIIGRLLDEVTLVGADGINLDFENVSEECAPSYLEFIRELSAECRTRSLVLSVDDYVPTYTRYLDRAEQARVADYIICMCYDEHHSGDTEAGSVASLPFVQKGIEETLKEVPSNQLIEAVPFFTRIWDGSGASLTSKAMGMWEAENYLEENGMTRNWDNEAGQYYSELLTGDSYIQVWLEDAKSLALKLALIREKELAGAAAWKLGLETGEVWPVLADALSLKS